MALALALLAAGSASRMRGGDKLLETVHGAPLLRHLALQALAARLGPVAVTLRRRDPARRAALKGLALTRLPVANAAEGMAASLRQAALWAQQSGAEGLILCPTDMPELTSGDFKALAAAFHPDGPPLRASTDDGRVGHPVLFPARLLPAFSTLAGDIGARNLLCSNPPDLVPLPGTHALTDLDTPEAWAAWRAKG
ncbi:MAG: NTP transferase domain-containing protein [Pararhodobacter sp.]